MKISDVFCVEKPIIGMLHLMGNNRKAILERAKIEIEQMYCAGIDGIIVEDFLCKSNEVEPALAWLRKQYPEKIYGVNVLNDYEKSFKIAKKYHARLVEMDSVSGHLPENKDKIFAEQLQKKRNSSVFLLGGVRFKYQPYLSGRTLEEDLNFAMQRCDGIVVTGTATAAQTKIEKIQEFRNIIGDFPLIVGAGMTLDTCAEQLAFADAAIVGSWFKENGLTEAPVDPERVKKFMNKVKELRG